jgi:hypothetical protein
MFGSHDGRVKFFGSPNHAPIGGAVAFWQLASFDPFSERTDTYSQMSRRLDRR